MEIAREREWAEAQKIEFSLDLVAAAKRHLRFLAAVDRTRHLYRGPALLRAIYRYNVCWLPLLAKHTEAPLSEEPLVVPLDCEWVWHCHRLNPLRYIADCKVLFGRVLDNRHVVSSVEGGSEKETEEIWNRFHPEEPYVLDFAEALAKNGPPRSLQGVLCTDYDLVSAVGRHSSFYYQVSRPHMGDDLFLQESVARYKGFLHLIKTNMEKAVKQSCVPTYDIDLIWHTHQLHPYSYSIDLVRLIGKVLEHDDAEVDRSEGKRLDVAFKRATEQWKETFGKRYWKAGVLYRGSAPDPSANALQSCDGRHEPCEAKYVEVLLEFVGIKNIPDGVKKGDLLLSLNMKQPDMFFRSRDINNLHFDPNKKEVALFWCEPNRDLLLELKTEKKSPTETTKALGCASLSLGQFLNPVSEPAAEMCVELAPPNPDAMKSELILLQMAISFTAPTLAPAHMLQSTFHKGVTYKNKCGGDKCKASTPCVEVAALGSPCIEVAALGSPCVEVAALGSPCVDVAALGDPCTDVSALGSPCTDVAALGSPCTNVSALGSPCIEVSALGSLCTTDAALGSPCIEVSALGSLCTTDAALGSPCIEVSALGSLCTTDAAPGSPCIEVSALGSLCTTDAALGSPYVEGAALGSPCVEVSALGSPCQEGSPCAEIEALGSQWTEAADLGSPWTEVTALGSPWTEVAALGSPWTEVAALGSSWTDDEALNSPCVEIAALGSPCTGVAPLDGLCDEVAALGSSYAEVAGLGTPWTEVAALGSPWTEFAAFDNTRVEVLGAAVGVPCTS